MSKKIESVFSELQSRIDDVDTHHRARNNGQLMPVKVLEKVLEGELRRAAAPRHNLVFECGTWTSN